MLAAQRLGGCMLLALKMP